MVRFAKALTLITVIVVICCATLPRSVANTEIFAPPSNITAVRVILDSVANEQLEALADSTRATRREQAACVTIYGYLPTANNSRVVAILEIGPAVPYVSDSVSIALPDSSQRLCHLDEPVVHTHIVPNEVWGRPSPFDSLRAYSVRPLAPFNIVVSVGDRRPSKITIYGLR